MDSLIREAKDKAEREKLRAEQDSLCDLRDQKRAEPRVVRDVWTQDEGLFRDVWAWAVDVEDRRAVLDDAIKRIVVRRGRPGRRGPHVVLQRLQIEWLRPEPEFLGPVVHGD